MELQLEWADVDFSVDAWRFFVTGASFKVIEGLCGKGKWRRDQSACNRALKEPRVESKAVAEVTGY